MKMRCNRRYLNILIYSIIIFTIMFGFVYYKVNARHIKFRTENVYNVNIGIFPTGECDNGKDITITDKARINAIIKYLNSVDFLFENKPEIHYNLTIGGVALKDKNGRHIDGIGIYDDNVVDTEEGSYYVQPFFPMQLQILMLGLPWYIGIFIILMFIEIILILMYKNKPFINKEIINNKFFAAVMIGMMLCIEKIFALIYVPTLFLILINITVLLIAAYVITLLIKRIINDTKDKYLRYVMLMKLFTVIIFIFLIYRFFLLVY